MIPRIHIHERHVLMWLLAATVTTITIVALWLVVLPRAGNKPDSPVPTRLRWMHPGQPSLVAEYFDPSVMSLPDARGFSRHAWYHFAPVTIVTYEPDRAPAFLVLPVHAALPVLLAEKPIDELVQAGTEWTTVAPVSAATAIARMTNSVLEVVGLLRGRNILQQPALPLAPPGLPVRMARVSLAVTSDGRVRYAVLERSSGNEALDGAAVAAVRQVWFTPEPNAHPLALTWGSVRLVWAVRI